MIEWILTVMLCVAYIVVCLLVVIKGEEYRKCKPQWKESIMEDVMRHDSICDKKTGVCVGYFAHGIQVEIFIEDDRGADPIICLMPARARFSVSELVRILVEAGKIEAEWGEPE